MTLWILLALFVFLCFLASGKHAFRTIFTLGANLFILYLIVQIMSSGINPVVIALPGCMVITALILFFNCGINAKTLSSFASVLTVLIIQITIILWAVGAGNVGGYGFEDLNDIAGFSYDIGIRITTVAAACMLIALIGAVTDTAIAVTTVVFEVKENRPDSTFSDLFGAGMRVGRDVTGTTLNTLYFAFLGEAATLMLWYHIYDYSFLEMINSTVFCREFIKICFSALGCILVMPLSSLFGAAALAGPLRPLVTRTETAIEKFKLWFNRDDE